MSTDVVMPQMGVSVSEGTVSRWLKGVGDAIEADETIVEISTDKVDTEVPAPAGGVVSEILVAEGETVPVGTRIAVIDVAGAAPAAAAAPAAEAAPAPAAAPVAAAVTPPPTATGAAEPPPHFGPGTTDGGYAAPAAGADDADDQIAVNGDGGDGGDGGDSGELRHFMSPVVARMVAEHGLDIGKIAGTGRGGRVTKKDVETFLAGGSAAPAAAAAAPPAAAAVAAAPAPAAAAQPAAAPAPSVAQAKAQTAAAAPAGAPAVAGTGEEVYRFNTIRKAIARHMRESVETAAQVTSVIEVDLTSVANIRRDLKRDFEKTHGVGLSFLPFIMRAVIDGIAKWPWMNAEIRNDEAIIKRYVNLGMAVAIDDAKGLLVPVIKNAEEKNLVGLSRAIVDLAAKARVKGLTNDEMSGATFTITNPGVFGTLIGTPIIPSHTVAIMDVGALTKRPVVVTDAFGNDSIAIRQMMYLPLSYDHRLIDGAYAAQFMRDVKDNLQGWGAAEFGG